ncbi:hypothetical protein [Paenibacillus sp. 32352]|uniref:hypothetical protein n=1 Tax=Paenibacillus sp. 32352 TaxID=1969111 RepID=UPI0009AEFF86|nr:hypothetical protein [Paenibacillus sp. 32352]
MKKSLTLATLTLASVLTVSTVSAAESQSITVVPVQTEATVNPTEAPASVPSVTVPIEPTVDNTNRTVADGIHLDVLYQAQAFIPEFTLELWSVKENKLISTTVGNSKNYDKVQGAYHLVFNHPQGYKLGDQLAFVLRKADGVVQHIKFRSEKPNENGQYTFSDLEPNTSYSFQIEKFTYVEGDEGSEKVISDLMATSLHPIRGSLQTDNMKIGLMLQSDSGSPLKKTPVSIKNLNDKVAFEETSDDDGLVWIDSTKLTTWKFQISSPGKLVNGQTKAEIELPQAVVTRQQGEAVTIPIVFENKVAVQSSEVKVNVKSVGNMDLSKSWSEVDVTLTSSDGVMSSYSVSPDANTISGLPDGTYKVALNSEYAIATIKTDPLIIKDGSGTMDIGLKPKYTLEIDKDGKPYTFTVINVESITDKKYKGKNIIAFGVIPGESFMIKDNETGKIDTIVIDPNSERTKVVLGAGVVFGGSVTIPHTGDSIVRDSLLFVAALLGAAVCFVLYKGRKKKNES